MHAWESIQIILDYIEDHPGEKFETEKLSNMASLSPFYFQRLFHRLVRKPVFEYIKLRKLAKASEDLKDGKHKIIDIAFDYGYSNHANFTRDFKQTYGITPSYYRGKKNSLNHFIKPDLQLKYNNTAENIPLITKGIVIEITQATLKNKIDLWGIEKKIKMTQLGGGRFTGAAKAGEIWDRFHNLKKNQAEFIVDTPEFGVLHETSPENGIFSYFAGSETSTGQITEKYAYFKIPQGDYMVCRFEAENFSELINSAVFKAYDFMNDWMKKKNLPHGNFSFEKYFVPEADSKSMELWIPIIPEENNYTNTEKWDRLSRDIKPSMNTISAYVKNCLWDELCCHLETTYQVKPLIEYSICSMQKGWNVKYKKSGRSLCTLYPIDGYFIALIVIGERELEETEFILPSLTDYVQRVYNETKAGMGQKWLMLEITDNTILEDAKKLISIRRGRKKKKQK